MKANQKKLTKDTLLVLIGKGILFTSYYFSVPFLIKLLGLEIYGFWITISSILSWVYILDLGVGNSLRNIIVGLKKENNTIEIREHVSTTYWILIIGISVFTLLISVTVYLLDLATFINIPKTIKPIAYLIFNFILIGVSASLVLRIIFSILQGYQEVGTSEILNSSPQVILLLIIIIFTVYYNNSLLQNLKFLGIIYASIPTILYLVINISLFNTVFKSISPQIRYIKWKLVQKILPLSLSFFIIQIAGLVIYATDNYIISLLFDNKSVAYYSISYRYFQIPIYLFNIVCTPIWPLISKYYYEDNTSAILKLKNKMILIWLAISILTLFMLAVSNYFYEFWTEKRIIIPRNLSIVLTIYVIISTLGSIYAVILNAMGKVKMQVISSVIIMLLNIPLSIIFSKNMNLGIIGIPIASIVCLCISGSIVYFHYEKIKHQN